MIRCIKLWTGADQKSHFEEGFIDLEPGVRGDALSVKFPITSASFHETDADPKLGWHPDADRQLVITRRVYTILDPKTAVPFRPAVAGGENRAGNAASTTGVGR